ncbi:MAG TPA: flagellar biosynthesis protein FlhF [Porticoccaceae bacterium]|nr:flagellar biosynthesis protein FlhF [Porticoccaceae bacterium]
MKIKKYFAADSREALRLVREEQGPDAMILANRKVPGGVEIIAALEYDERVLQRAEAVDPPELVTAAPGSIPHGSAPPIPAAQARPAPVLPAQAFPAQALPVQAVPVQALPVQALPVQALPGQASAPTTPVVDPAVAAMRLELDALRSLLESRLGQFGAPQRGRDDALQRQLEELGLDAELAARLVGEVQPDAGPEQSWPQALAALARRIAVTDDDILTHGGVVALVGPTGVGKTTMIAKLAARYALRHGKRHVALVTTDNFRIGAGEQLHIYGRLLGIPVYSTEDGRDLESILEELAARHLVLIDTAGSGQRDRELAERQAELLTGNRELKAYLVLAANVQRAVLNEVAQRFGSLPLLGCLITKVDEAANLGEVLSVVAGQGLPVAYVGDGQRVPEDLHPARSAALVARAVALAPGAGTMAPESAATQRKQAHV